VVNLINNLIKEGKYSNISSIMATCHPNNKRSSKVLQKAGFEFTENIKYEDQTVRDLYKMEISVQKPAELPLDAKF
jgi:RimJ/RimL family protein N-acetyltransferase